MTATERNPQVQQWTQLAQQLRVDSIRCTTAAVSGHPTSSMSAADLMSALMISYLRYDFDNPRHPNNDHLIFSKGHDAPCLLRNDCIGASSVAKRPGSARETILGLTPPHIRGACQRLRQDCPPL